jgi:hypothetical protein
MQQRTLLESCNVSFEFDTEEFTYGERPILTSGKKSEVDHFVEEPSSAEKNFGRIQEHLASEASTMVETLL